MWTIVCPQLTCGLLFFRRGYIQYRQKTAINADGSTLVVYECHLYFFLPSYFVYSYSGEKLSRCMKGQRSLMHYQMQRKPWEVFLHKHIFFLYCALPCNCSVTEKAVTWNKISFPFRASWWFASLSEAYILRKENKWPCEYCRWQDGLLFTVLNSHSDLILYSALPFCVWVNNPAESVAPLSTWDMGMALPHSMRGLSPLPVSEHSEVILLKRQLFRIL